MGLGFLFQKKMLARLKQKTTFALMCFVTKIGWFFQSTFHIKSLKTRLIYCLRLIKTSQSMCTSKILRDLCFTKQIIKIKKYICKNCLQCFGSKNVLTEHNKVCLSINCAQSIRLEKGAINLKII